MAEFDRENPLFEKESVPIEVISSDNTRSSEHFTVRVLQGHRGNEKVFRFELSDECRLVWTAPDSNLAAQRCITPGRSRGFNSHQTPHAPVIHAPFMTADRGRGCNAYGENGNVQLTLKSSAITNQPVNLFELEVGELDFDELRRDQALLVDFNDFALSLISLMKFCWLEDDCSHSPDDESESASNSCTQSINRNTWNNAATAEVQWGNANWEQQQKQQQGMRNASPFRQQHMMRSASPYGKPPVSTYTCRLEMTTTTSSSSANGNHWSKKNDATLHARYSIVESNQFRELTHLALTLNVGTDKSIRQYLSSRLSQAMAHNALVTNQLKLQKQRCDAAERNAIDANKRLADMTQAHEFEKYQLQCHAEQRLQTETNCHNAEITNVKTSKDSEIQALKEELLRYQSTFEEKVRVLEETIRKLNEDKSLCQSENEQLTSRLNQQETTNKAIANELTTLRTRLERITDQKNITEKNLQELHSMCNSLETANNDHQNTISQSKSQIASTEQVYADAKQTISRQVSQIDDLRRRLADAETEASKYKELAGRYQVNRAEMKKRIKEKVEMIQKQDETIRSGEKENTSLKHNVERIGCDLMRVQKEKDDALNELSESKQKLEDATKKLDNNQQVREVCITTDADIVFISPSIIHNLQPSTTMGRLSRDKRDVFYRRAKETGYRARSAFKLLQIDGEFDLFGLKTSDECVDGPETSITGGDGFAHNTAADNVNDVKQKPKLRVQRAVDLCAAPGGWSQVLLQRMTSASANDTSNCEPIKKEAPKIVAVDLWPMEPLDGVDIIRGDITSLNTARQIIDCSEGERAELVVCDGAPDVTGLHAFDSYIQHQLLMAAINITTHILCQGGTFVAKIFRTREVGLIYTQLRLLFQDVQVAKPTASRNASVESFVVCRGFGYGKFEMDKCLNLALEGGWYEGFSGVGGLREYPGQEVEPSTVPFVSCAKLEGVDSGGFEFLDSDKSYPVQEGSEQTALAPLAPPIQPPYEAAKKKEFKGSKNQ